ncbi:transmembrane protein 176 [Osmerus mordax]|uniref:transmembrane protein 176 n=1 Tax=Osmerus mordax TaxID=8014 RepID=UPI00350F5EFA
MAVTVSRDLTVSVTTDINADKLFDRTQVLKASIQKGEPKALGVSQVILGVIVMSYSIPLLFTEFTVCVNFGVPWWSGLSFIAAGAVAIRMDKHTNMKIVGVCLLMTSAVILLSLLALIFYVVDLSINLQITCPKEKDDESECIDQAHNEELNRSLKSSLALFTIIQTTISCVLSINLFKERRNIGRHYDSLTQTVPATPTDSVLPDFNRPITASDT